MNKFGNPIVFTYCNQTLKWSSLKVLISVFPSLNTKDYTEHMEVF